MQICLSKYLFLSLSKEQQDPDYCHPAWPAVQRDIEMELATHSQTTKDSPSRDAKRRRSWNVTERQPLNVPINLEGCGNDVLDMENEMLVCEDRERERHCQICVCI